MKNNNRNKINQLFSAILVIGFVICSYFFSTLAMNAAGAWGVVIYMAIFVVFGLLLFYATRVGEGKAVKRFSLSVLLLVDLPALYIILATYIQPLPLNAQLGEVPIVAFLAAVALGYGIPYTFLSGFELVGETPEEEVNEDAEIENEEEEPVLVGGLAEELLEAQKEEETDNQDEEEKEAVEEDKEDKEEEKEEEEKEEAAEEEKKPETSQQKSGKNKEKK